MNERANEETTVPGGGSFQTMEEWELERNQEVTEQYEGRLTKLKSLKITGNILLDAPALFEAAGWEESNIPTDERAAIKQGDTKELLKIFKERQTKRQALPQMREGAKAYFDELHRLIDEIIKEAERNQK